MKKSVLIDTKGFQLNEKTNHQWKKKQKLFSNFLMIPFSRILLCLTLHYLKREKERLSTCINNAFTFNYFCFNSTFFVNYFFCVIQWNTIPWFQFIACFNIFCTFFQHFFSFIFIPSINKCNSLCCIQNRHNHERTQKSPTYNCTHPCTPMRLYFFHCHTI